MEEHLQRMLLAGALGLTIARKAAAILDSDQHAEFSGTTDGLVLRAILDAANECVGLFDERPPAERWCDAVLHLLDLAAFAADLDRV